MITSSMRTHRRPRGPSLSITYLLSFFFSSFFSFQHNRFQFPTRAIHLAGRWGKIHMFLFSFIFWMKKKQEKNRRRNKILVLIILFMSNENYTVDTMAFEIDEREVNRWRGTKDKVRWFQWCNVISTHAANEYTQLCRVGRLSHWRAIGSQRRARRGQAAITRHNTPEL